MKSERPSTAHSRYFVSSGSAASEGFFFSSRRRHTRCGRDWSSDVCSSDLDREDADALALRQDLADVWQQRRERGQRGEWIEHRRLHVFGARSVEEASQDAVEETDGSLRHGPQYRTRTAPGQSAIRASATPFVHHGARQPALSRNSLETGYLRSHAGVIQG